MTEKTKKAIVLGLIVGFAALGALGYSQKKGPLQEPQRVLYKGKGGPVIFDHKAHASPGGFVATCEECHHLTKLIVHETDQGSVVFDHHVHSTSADYGLECGDCHHELSLALDSRIQKCGVCHATGSEENAAFEKGHLIHKTAMGVKCVDCHRMRLTFKTDEGPVVFDHHVHSTSEDYDLECSECHHKPAAGTAAKTPRCDTCHSEGSKSNASFEDGDIHTGSIGVKCAECHEEEIEEESCEFCHKEDGSDEKSKKATPGVKGRHYQSCDFCHKAGAPDAEALRIEHCDECHGMGEGHDATAGPDDLSFGECSGFSVSGRKTKGPHPGLGAKCVQCHSDWTEENKCALCHSLY